MGVAGWSEGQKELYTECQCPVVLWGQSAAAKEVASRTHMYLCSAFTKMPVWYVTHNISICFHVTITPYP